MINIDKLIRQKRKTVGLFITSEGELVVKAPLRAPMREIKRIVEMNTQWIIDKQKTALTNQSEKTSYEFKNGETFPFLGKVYTLSLVDRQVEPLVFNHGFSLVKSAAGDGRFHFENWYRHQAFGVIKPRVDYFSQKYGFTYHQLRIKKLRSRWGSCSQKSNLNFNLWLVLAPIEVVDYVVMHELCHILEQNHSKQYWQKVGSFMPDYAQHRGWLKKNGSGLMLW